MAKTGWLDKKQEKALAKMLDEALPLKGWLKMISGFLSGIIIKFLDDRILEQVKVPSGFKIEFSHLADGVIESNAIAIEASSAAILNMLVKLPKVKQSAKQKMFKGAVELIVGAAMLKIELK